MLTAAEASRLSVINCIALTMDGQHVITASLRGPPQVRNVMVGSFIHVSPSVMKLQNCFTDAI